MPQILKSKDELRRMILDEVRNYVVCPEGTDVNIRADPDHRWTADTVPHPEALSSTPIISTTSAMSFVA